MKVLKASSECTKFFKTGRFSGIIETLLLFKHKCLKKCAGQISFDINMSFYLEISSNKEVENYYLNLFNTHINF